MTERALLFPSLLVSPDFVEDHLGELVIADVRWNIQGRSSAYEDGHLPGALKVDLEEHLTGELGGVKGRHPLPDAATFASTLASLGIASDAHVLAYDDVGGSIAGRLVWMLRSIGQSVALMDGGITNWHGPIERGDPPSPSPVERAAVDYDPRYYATLEEIEQLGDKVLLDARPASRYHGEGPSMDARAGHIPGARSLPWETLLDPVTKRYLARDELQKRLAEVGIDEQSEVIASCGSGVTACPDLIALEHAGLGHGRLFVPSFSGWSADLDHEVET